MGDSNMEASMSEEHLLQDFADENETVFLHHKRPGRKPMAPRVLWLAIACLLASHAFLLIQFQRLRLERPVQYELPPHDKHLLGLSRFGMQSPAQVPYIADTLRQPAYRTTRPPCTITTPIS